MRGSHLRFVQKVGGTAATLVGHDSFVVRAGRPFYEFALRVLSFDRGIPWDINGSSFRVLARWHLDIEPNPDELVSRLWENEDLRDQLAGRAERTEQQELTYQWALGYCRALRDWLSAHGRV